MSTKLEASDLASGLIVTALAGWALSYVLEPFIDFGVLRSILAVWAVRATFGSRSTP